MWDTVMPLVLWYVRPIHECLSDKCMHNRSCYTTSSGPGSLHRCVIRPPFLKSMESLTGSSITTVLKMEAVYCACFQFWNISEYLGIPNRDVFKDQLSCTLFTFSEVYSVHS